MVDEVARVLLLLVAEVVLLFERLLEVLAPRVVVPDERVLVLLPLRVEVLEDELPERDDELVEALPEREEVELVVEVRVAAVLLLSDEVRAEVVDEVVRLVVPVALLRVGVVPALLVRVVVELLRDVLLLEVEPERLLVLALPELLLRPDTELLLPLALGRPLDGLVEWLLVVGRESVVTLTAGVLLLAGITTLGRSAPGVQAVVGIGAGVCGARL